MAWGESSVTEQRLRFVVAACRKQASMTELCREFQISRQTGYTWLKRYQAGGSQQVVERSRRPAHSPQRTSAALEQAVIALRRLRPDWGAAKLRVVLQQQHPNATLCERTVHRILERNDLLQEDDRHRPAVERFERSSPNELWQMDFKGPQGFNCGSPVGPLSIVDDHSRYIVALQHLGSTRAEGVRDTLERTFSRAGVPAAMLVDHGTPWWNHANPWGLSELAVWIIRQGVRLLYSAFRHPQTQGKVERMHGSLQRAIRRRHADPTDQNWLDAFRDEYNHLRPHQALGMQVPFTRWRPSERCYQAHPPEWTYDAAMDVCRLDGDGRLSWSGQRWDISGALRRQLVGIERIGDRALVYFCHTAIRELDLTARRALPLAMDVIGSLQR
jgi:transposase InsO family protein